MVLAGRERYDPRRSDETMEAPHAPALRHPVGLRPFDDAADAGRIEGVA